MARLCFIDGEIASGKFPNTGYLAKKWEGISISSISRDIEFIKDRFNALDDAETCGSGDECAWVRSYNKTMTIVPEKGDEIYANRGNLIEF